MLEAQATVLAVALHMGVTNQRFVTPKQDPIITFICEGVSIFTSMFFFNLHGIALARILP